MHSNSSNKNLISRKYNKKITCIYSNVIKKHLTRHHLLNTNYSYHKNTSFYENSVVCICEGDRMIISYSHTWSKKTRYSAASH